jgi:hypothetical protein
MDLASSMQVGESLWILSLFQSNLNWDFPLVLRQVSSSFSWDFGLLDGPIWWLSGSCVGHFLVWYGWPGIVAQFLLFLLKTLVHLSLYAGNQKVSGINYDFESLLLCCQLFEGMLEKGLVNGYGSLLVEFVGSGRGILQVLCSAFIMDHLHSMEMPIV